MKRHGALPRHDYLHPPLDHTGRQAGCCMHVQCRPTLWVWPMISHYHSVALPIPLPARLLVAWRSSPHHLLRIPVLGHMASIGSMAAPVCGHGNIRAPSSLIHVCPSTPAVTPINRVDADHINGLPEVYTPSQSKQDGGRGREGAVTPPRPTPNCTQRLLDAT